MKKTIRNNKDLFFIVGFFLLFTILLVVKVCRFQNFTPEWDESHHLKMGYYFYSAIISKNWSFLYSLFTDSGQIYPPIYHLLISIFYFITGIYPKAGIMANIPSVLILMLAIYGLGIELGNRKAGLLSAVLTPMLPLFITLQERILIDYTSVAMFFVSFYLLFKTQKFTNRGYSILFGLSIFIGLLIKWPIAIPSVPFIFYAIYSLYINKSKRLSVFSNIIIALLISSVSLVWYFCNYQYMVKNLGFFWDPNGFAQILWNMPKGLNIQNLLLYFYQYPTGHFGVGLITLIFFLYSLFIPRKNKNINYLIVSILITFGVLTYLDDKSAFYAVYIYPQLMLTTTIALYSFKKQMLKYLLITLLVMSVLVNFTLSQISYMKHSQISISLFGKNIMLFPNYGSRFLDLGWPTKDVADYIYERNSCTTGVLIFSDNRYINVANIGYYLALYGVNYNSDAAYSFYNPAKDSEFDLEILESYNCIVSKTGYPGLFANPKIVESINNYLYSNVNYDLVKFKSPDNTDILLYFKK